MFFRRWNWPISRNEPKRKIWNNGDASPSDDDACAWLNWIFFWIFVFTFLLCYSLRSSLLFRAISILWRMNLWCEKVFSPHSFGSFVRQCESMVIVLVLGNMGIRIEFFSFIHFVCFRDEMRMRKYSFTFAFDFVFCFMQIKCRRYYGRTRTHPTTTDKV